MHKCKTKIIRIKIKDVINLNTYVIMNTENNEAVIIDPGMNPKQLFEEVNLLNCKVIAILLTHSHWDHICGIHLWKNIDVYIHDLDYFRFSDDFNYYLQRPAFIHNRRLDYFPSDINFKPLTGDKGSIQISWLNINWIHLPGHSPGQVGYYYENEQEKVLFSADCLFYELIGITNLPFGVENSNQFSLNKILTTYSEEVLVYPGHGYTSTIGHERKNNQHIEKIKTN